MVVECNRDEKAQALSKGIWALDQDEAFAFAPAGKVEFDLQGFDLHSSFVRFGSEVRASSKCKRIRNSQHSRLAGLCHTQHEQEPEGLGPLGAEEIKPAADKIKVCGNRK